MHQHIFKVGWLLTHNRSTTVVFYYTAFLPGIALRTLCRWLVAGILKVRATRSAHLPAHDEISELQLNLVQISPDTRARKRFIIEGAPVIFAFALLWLIATDVLDLAPSLRIMTGGALADIGWAIKSLVGQPDFWLWFYLMFTIANTMLPPISQGLRERRRLIAAVILASAFAVGLASNVESMAALGSNARGMLGSLSYVLLATSIINFVMALALGLIEAIIERITGHSATFDDGKLITRTRQQARAERGDRARPRRPRPTRHAAPKPQRPARSIYALPLPIPGPPGQEPVSKPVAAVLNVLPRTDPDLKSVPDDKPVFVVSSRQVDEDGKFASRPKTTPETLERSENDSERGGISAAHQQQKAKKPSGAEPHSTAAPKDIEQVGPERAPFRRPFAADPEDIEDPDDNQENQTSELGYLRPFAPQQGLQAKREANSRDTDKALSTSDEELPTSRSKPASDVPMPKTFPVPKPSQRLGRDDKDSQEVDGDSGELRYEPLDDVDVYDDEESS